MFGALCILLALPAFAQQTPGEQDFKISTEVDLVLLDVAVRDAHGGFVSGLGKQNFRVVENGKQQPITLFGKQDEPVTIGLIVDNSGSMQMKRADVVTAALAFVQSSNPQDEVFVATFNDKVSLGLPEDTPFSSNIDQLRSALTAKPPAGRTSLYDAVDLGLNQAMKGHQDRKTLIVISDGGDNASYYTFDDVLHKAQQSNVTIYTVGIYDELDQDKNPTVLKRLARETGGEMFRPYKLADVKPVCEQIARDIRSRYTLGFVPAPQGPAYRTVRVLASDPEHPKLNVRTRTGYLLPGRSASR